MSVDSHVNHRTHEQYVEKLSNRRLEVLGKYTRSHDKIEHRCLKCGYEWEVEPSNILSGHGCPICAMANQAKDHSDYIKEISNRTIKPIEKYQGRNTYIKHKCLLCGHIWPSRPKHIIRGGRCPRCETDRNLDEEEVYLIQTGMYTKIGVSENPRKRLNNLQSASPFDMKLILTFNMKENDAYFIEHILHDKLDDFHQSGEWFELTSDAIEIVLGIVDNYGLNIEDTDKDLLKEDDLHCIGEEDSRITDELLDKAPLSKPLKEILNQYHMLAKEYRRLHDKNRIENDECKILAEQYHDLHIENSELRERVAILQSKLKGT